jgi:hypothetical protein
MRVLSSKRFFIPKAATVSWDRVKAWYDGADRGLDDCTLVVTLEAMDGKRRRKISARRQLLERIADGVVEDENAGSVWERHGYRFVFPARKYFWNGTEIYVTVNEALFLYRWLVLGDNNIRNTQRYYLRNMRKRLGKEFLSEETAARRAETIARSTGA